MSTASPESFQEARVIDVVRETESTVTVLFATASRLSHRPGQYVQAEFRLGGVRYRRPYSLSSLPDDDYHAITVRHLPGGRVSRYVTADLAIGDRFRVSGARGDFVLPDSRAGRRFVFIAGGVGIAPVLPLVRALLAMPAPPPVSLLYYSRHADDIVFRDRLSALADDHPGLDCRLVVTGPRAGWTGLHEPFAVDRALAAGAADPQALYYVCGPDALNAAAREGLLAAGVPAARVLVEQFAAAASPAPPAEGQPATFVRRGLLLNRRRRLRTRPGETLLAAAERAGLAPDSECRQGTCGRCRVTLLSGEVVMDEPNALSPADVRAGRVLACMARPLSPVVLSWRG